MTLIELSNIFNTIVQNIPGLNNYHFGFLSDINTVIKNNSNPSDKCQNKYPIVMFEPPTGSYRPDDGKLYRNIRLLFADRQDSDKHGTTCPTLVEKMSDLEGFALSFLRTLQTLKTSTPCLQKSLRKQEAGFILDGYQFHDRLVTYEVNFSLVTPYNTDCINFDLDAISQDDDEKVTCTPFINTFSMLFDGVDEKISLGGNSFFSFTDGVNDLPFTLNAWVNPSGTGANMTVLGKRGAGSFDPTDEFHFVITSTNKLRFQLMSGNQNNTLLVDSVNSIPLNQWTFVSATYDGSKNINGLKVYANGVELNTTKISQNYTGIQQFDNFVLAGGRLLSAFYAGLMDEISIYNRALTDLELLALYNEGQPNDPRLIPGLYYGCRLGDEATYETNKWIFNDYVGLLGVNAESFNMEETDRTENVPN
jgi:hypothetical protein